MKVSIKVQIIAGTLSRMQSRMLITFKCIFSGEDVQKISYFHVFLEKDHLSFSDQKKKYHILRKKIPSFQVIQERSYSSAIFIGKTIFLGHLKKISYFHVYFWERSSFIFFRLKKKIIFSGKRNITCPDNTIRKIIFQCDFFGKTIFSEHLKEENMVFRAVTIVAAFLDDTTFSITAFINTSNLILKTFFLFREGMIFRMGEYLTKLLNYFF